MTVAVETPSVDYAENGVTLTFPIPFTYAQASDVKAYRTASGIEAALGYGTAYSVAGGTLTLVASVAGATLSIRRETARAQTADYTTTGAFTAESHEAALDRQARVAQEQDVEIARTLRAPRGEPGHLLEPLATRAGLPAAFDGLGRLRGVSYGALAAALSASLLLTLPTSFKGDPGSAGTGYATRVALAAAGSTAALLDDAGLNEKGRSGRFVFDNANLAAKVALDPAQGVYVAPASDPTGASGAWVRQYYGALDVRWFGAKGDGVANDQLAIERAVALARADSFQEQQIDFPAGKYNVGRLRWRDWNFLTFRGLGTVQLLGVDPTQKFILGDNRYDETPGLETFTQHLNFIGGPWLIAPGAGVTTYECAMRIQNTTDCVFHNLKVSGTFTPAGGAGNRKAIEIEFAYDNHFENCDVGLPGLPIGAGYSYGIFCGTNNANNNRWINPRIGGFNPPVANTVAMRRDSIGNSVWGGDFSSLDTVFEDNAARGCHADGFYCENVSRVVRVIFASEGCNFTPSFVKIAAGGTAYDLGGPLGTTRTVAYSIRGGRHEFGADSTGIRYGTNAYAPVYQPGLDLAALPAVPALGTPGVGSGGTDFMKGFSLATERLIFADAPAAAPNPTDLWWVKSGFFASTNALAAPMAGNRFEYRRINDQVHFDILLVPNNASVNASEAVFAGNPFLPQGVSQPVFHPSFDHSEVDIELVAVGNTFKARRRSTGAYLTNAQLAGKTIAGQMSMLVN